MLKSSSTPHPTHPVVQRTILVVDDILSVRYYHSYILKKAGFKCETASDGVEALQKLRMGAIDLVLLDVIMPNLNGWDFIKQLRHEPALAKIPVLVISSEPLSDKVCKESSAGMGAVGYAKKPISPESLYPIIEQLLGVSCGLSAQVL